MNTRFQIIITLSFALLSAVYRVVDAQFNLFHLTPILALALFSGAKIKNNWLAAITPLIGMFLADLYFQFFTTTPGFYGWCQVLNYASIVAVVYLGSFIKQPNTIRLFGFSIGGALLFWVLSNFGVWLSSPEHGYSLNLQGLITCFTNAIPFLKSDFATKSFVNSISSTIIFSYFFHYVYQYATNKIGAKAVA
jgi:hypothetical protein